MTLPLSIAALLYGLFSALSLPLGAALGILLSPVSERTIAIWLAVGSGSLVFSVATQLFGDTLFSLVAISRKLGPFDEGCVHDICERKFWDLMLQLATCIVGAGLYVLLARCLEKWFPAHHSRDSGTIERGASPSNLVDAVPQEPDSLMPTEISGGIAEQPGDGAMVALSMWLGMLLDSIPESLMLGFMTNQHQITTGFIASIFLANFPEAFSGGSILRLQGMSFRKVMMLWSSIFVITGALAMVGSLIMPAHGHNRILVEARLATTSAAQGLTGGAMLAMTATAMLPEAFKGAKNYAGIFFVLGFVISVLLETLDAYLGGAEAAIQPHPHQTPTTTTIHPHNIVI